VSSSTGRAARPQQSPDGVAKRAPARRSLAGQAWAPFARRFPRWFTSRVPRPSWGRNGYATAALVAGALGAALVTIPVSLVCGAVGLLRAQRGGPGAPGKVRSWLGIGFAVGWSVLAGYLMPHLVRAADPGCVAYKGPALVAYRKVIDDFREGTDDAGTASDLATAIRQLDGAAAASRSGTASGSLGALSAQLQTVLADFQARPLVPREALQALNRDSALADRACGTVRL
jgi:hypothetical protein